MAFLSFVLALRLAGYMQRVLDQNAINHFLDILQEEAVCRGSNGDRDPASALTE